MHFGGRGAHRLHDEEGEKEGEEEWAGVDGGDDERMIATCTYMNKLCHKSAISLRHSCSNADEKPLPTISSLQVQQHSQSWASMQVNNTVHT